MTYGSRTTSHNATPRVAAVGHGEQHVRPLWGWIEQTLDYLAELRVPHEWFLHFYVVSVACSLFWAVQIISKTSLVVALCRNSRSGGTMSMNQIVLTWSLMAAQGVRRLIESITLGKASASKMWFVHWILGTVFYVAMSVAVWIEGAGTLLTLINTLHSLGLADSIFSSRYHPASRVTSPRNYLFRTNCADDARCTFVHHGIWHSARLPHVPSITSQIHAPRSSDLSYNDISALRS